MVVIENGRGIMHVHVIQFNIRLRVMPIYSDHLNDFTCYYSFAEHIFLAYWFAPFNQPTIWMQSLSNHYGRVAWKPEFWNSRVHITKSQASYIAILTIYIHMSICKCMYIWWHLLCVSLLRYVVTYHHNIKGSAHTHRFYIIHSNDWMSTYLEFFGNRFIYQISCSRLRVHDQHQAGEDAPTRPTGINEDTT